jgi:putative MATE family efflux protein
MARTGTDEAASVGILTYAPSEARRDPTLLRQLLWLALPILAEQALHSVVGLTDVYLAGHLRRDAVAATAAVGSVSYILWLLGLIAGAIGTGSTALVARAVGARHRSLANAVCGQTVTASVLTGIGLSAFTILCARQVALITGLSGEAYGFALFYVRVLSVSLPFSIFLLSANACLRGAGDTVTPAVSVIVVDLVNLGLSASLSRGWLGLPELGFRGIAIGTVVAYVVGGLLQLGVLLRGRGGLKLHVHRLRPHWHTLKRILKIGLPSGAEGLLVWVANFSIVAVINQMDASNVAGSAHIITVRLESMSFLVGYAFAMAAATMVGQSLGMNDPRRAARSAYLSYAAGGGAMGFMGVLFVTMPRVFAHFLAEDPAIVDLASRCLFITGFAQLGFAASMIFSSALRGAGDTVTVMAINLASILGLRLTAALVVAKYFRLGLPAIWVVLATELTIRGAANFLWFARGKWKHLKV